MANPNIDYDRVSTILAAIPAFSSEEQLCKAYRIHRVTLTRYKKRLEVDTKLQQAVKKKQITVIPTWQEDLKGALRTTIRVMLTQIESAEGKIEHLTKTTAALQALGELSLSHEILTEEASSVEESEPVAV